MSAPLQEGDLLAGKYRVGRTLGSGGMGTVVAATHVQLGRPVAIKFMHGEAAQNEESVHRFVREARAAAALRSEHVVQVLDVGTDSGTPYIVMEHLVGQDLGALLEGAGRLPAEQAVDYLLQASLALAEAHSRGIVHRDLKPANLFLAQRPDGTPLIKVLDFGISKLSNSVTGTTSLKLTKPRAMIGSPEYMAPEQMMGAANVDARADIWSLGVILYEVLKGKPPFAGESLLDLCMRVVNEPHPPLDARALGLPGALSAAVDRCLRKSPAERFANLADMAAAIAPHGSAGALGTVERIAAVLGVRPAAAGGLGAPGRRWAIVAGGVAAVASVGGALALTRRRPPAASSAAPPAPAPPAPAPPETGPSRPESSPGERAPHPSPAVIDAPLPSPRREPAATTAVPPPPTNRAPPSRKRRPMSRAAPPASQPRSPEPARVTAPPPPKPSTRGPIITEP